MKNTLGSRIAELRKAKGYKQDELAEMLGVSPQAVSKYENDLSCPDIMLLPKLAEILGVSVDSLLSGEVKPETQYLPAEARKNFDEMILTIRLESGKDRVKVNLPLPLLRVAIDSGISIGDFNNKKMNIDWDTIIKLIENGVVGRLLEMESEDGDVVIIEVK